MAALLAVFALGVLVGVVILGWTIKKAIENEIGRWFGWCVLICAIALPAMPQTNAPRLQPYQMDSRILAEVIAGRMPKPVAASPQSNPQPPQFRALATATSLPNRFHPSPPPPAAITVRSGLSGHMGDGNGQPVKVTIVPTAAISSSDEIVNGRIAVRAWINQAINGAEVWCTVPLSVSVSTSPQVFTVALPPGAHLEFEHRVWYSVKTSAWLSDESVTAARFLRPVSAWRERMSCPQ